MQCQIYYNSAIRKLARLSTREYHYNLLSILAAMLLFCYIESSWNFYGYSCHMKGMSSIFANDVEKIRTSPSGNELLVKWEQLKYYKRWIRIHFSTLHFQRSQSALQLSLQSHILKDSKCAGRTILLSILCESYRLCSKAFLWWWNRPTLLSNTIDDRVDSSHHEEDYIFLFHKEPRRLDMWDPSLSLQNFQYQLLLSNSYLPGAL